MSVDHDTIPEAGRPPAAGAPTPLRAHRHFGGGRGGFRRRRPRVRKLRLLLVLSAFCGLAVISLLFGVLTSIASDLPQLENKIQFRASADSYLYDDTGKPIGPLAPPSTPAIDSWKDISQNMVHAIVAVEDRGFWSESGISLRGLLRAALSDATGGQHEGASTIPEEFIKNVRQEEDHRTVLEKLIEAGMAFQLSHRPGWTHKKILTEYLNTIYFGNGALGIEAAARVYFGWAHGYDSTDPADESKGGCGDPDEQYPKRRECASMLTPAQAALLAGMVANPTEFDPVAHPVAAMARRNLVLTDMYNQHYLTYSQYKYAQSRPLPTRADIKQPQASSIAPYFTSWVEPLVVRALQNEGLSAKAAQYEAYYGGLKIKLSLDLQMQAAAQAAVDEDLPSGKDEPTAALVAIDNRTGEVRAMVSGNGNYQQQPFNLATLGYRQPGSAFKLFTLAAALTTGRYGPDSVFVSKPITIKYRTRLDRTAHFKVRNFANEYVGPETLTEATAISDNSVFAQLGTAPGVGTKRVASFAKAMGIRSPISLFPAMILGGLTTGVSALDLAHAYSTEANDGVKVYNPTLGDIDRGPIGIDSISNCGKCVQHNFTNASTWVHQTVYSPQIASTIHSLLLGPVDDSSGTGTAAAIPGVDVAGKTGTTSNYVDAWFVGYTPKITVAVWVGYPNSGKPMLHNFKGGPVEGGTYPADIWHTFVVNAIQIMTAEAEHKTAHIDTTTTSSVTVPSTGTQTGATTSTSATGTSTVGSAGNAGGQGQAGAGSTSATAGTPGAGQGQATTPASTNTPAPPAGAPQTGSNGGSGL